MTSLDISQNQLLEEDTVFYFQAQISVLISKMVCFKTTSISPRKGVLLKVTFDIVCIALVGFGILAIKLGADPYHRGFFCDDESLKHPYREDTVTVTTAACVGFIVPVAIILASEFALRKNKAKCVVAARGSIRTHSWVMAAYANTAVFIFGLAVSQFLTEVGKYSVGRLRPHFLTICNPDVTVQQCKGFVVERVCTSTDTDKMTEARLSFPSGHSSFAVYCMLFAILYLQGRMLCRNVLFLKPLAQLVLFSLAFYTCLSRISDYKHHWSDVLAGAILGIVVCMFTVVCLTDFGKTICHHGSCTGSVQKLDERDPQTQTIFESSESRYDDKSVSLSTSPRSTRDITSESHIVVQVDL